MTSLEIYCQHVSRNSVHCNMHTSLAVWDFDVPVREVIEKSEWAIVDGDVKCPMHNES